MLVACAPVPKAELLVPLALLALPAAVALLLDAEAVAPTAVAKKPAEVASCQLPYCCRHWRYCRTRMQNSLRRPRSWKRQPPCC